MSDWGEQAALTVTYVSIHFLQYSKRQNGNNSKAVREMISQFYLILQVKVKVDRFVDKQVIQYMVLLSVMDTYIIFWLLNGTPKHFTMATYLPTNWGCCHAICCPPPLNGVGSTNYA